MYVNYSVLLLYTIGLSYLYALPKCFLEFRTYYAFHLPLLYYCSSMNNITVRHECSIRVFNAHTY